MSRSTEWGKESFSNHMATLSPGPWPRFPSEGVMKGFYKAWLCCISGSSTASSSSIRSTRPHLQRNLLQVFSFKAPNRFQNALPSDPLFHSCHYRLYGRPPRGGASSDIAVSSRGGGGQMLQISSCTQHKMRRIHPKRVYPKFSIEPRTN